jgi:hypothetical protein
MVERQYRLEWDRPFLPDAATHVTLFDGGTGPMFVVASGHGAEDASALFDLWTALKDRHESAKAIAFVAEEYQALTGKPPSRRTY